MTGRSRTEGPRRDVTSNRHRSQDVTNEGVVEPSIVGACGPVRLADCRASSQDKTLTGRHQIQTCPKPLPRPGAIRREVPGYSTSGRRRLSLPRGFIWVTRRPPPCTPALRERGVPFAPSPCMLFRLHASTARGRHFFERSLDPSRSLRISLFAEHAGKLTQLSDVQACIQADPDDAIAIATPRLERAASMPTVASARLCQSRLSRSKISPNRCVFRNRSMAGAKSNCPAPLTGAPTSFVWLGRAGSEQGVACRYRVTLARVAANHQVSRQRDTGTPDRRPPVER